MMFGEKFGQCICFTDEVNKKDLASFAVPKRGNRT